MKPICVSCARFYRPKKSGFAFIEGMPKCGVSCAAPGNIAPDQWENYKLWLGDKWKCQGCGHEIVVGTAMEPLAEHYQADFDKKLTAYNAQFRVNDC